MHKLYLLALILVASMMGSLISRPVEAISGDIVISQVQINNSLGSRLVEIYNNSDMPIDITDWCIFHSSATEKSIPDKLTCFQDPDTSVRLILGARSYALIGSAQLGIKADLVMTSGLGGITGGHVYVVDADGVEHDRLGWGTAEHSETSAALLISGNIDHVIERKQESPGVYKDTNGNLDDFYNSTLRSGPEPGSGYIIGAIYDVVDVCNNMPDIQVLVPSGYYLNRDGSCSPIVVDLCSNIDDIQIVLPTGYMVDGDGICVADICQNIDGLQQITPDGMELDSAGNCVVHDECLNIPDIQTKLPDGYEVDNSGICSLIPIDVCNNLDGVQQGLPEGMEFDANGGCVVTTDKCSNLDDFQEVVPDGYSREGGDICSLHLLPLQITELLPNAAGSDDGNEFIELYNSNDVDINLSSYIFYVGNNYTHAYSFPIGLYIKAGEYKAFLNDEIKFTLVNTTSSVHLFGLDNLLINETQIYNDPPEGMAWALIDGIWQYTNQPTQNEANKVSLVEPEPIVTEKNNVPEIVSSLAPCASNQYRSPETNRCRLLVAVSSSLTPCKDGQYRSEETNRCRSIASDVADLTVCAEGQERNPETNRCRSIVAVSSSLTPCKDGQYRSEETNRCRSIASDVADLTVCAEGQERNPETNRCRSITAVLGASNLKPCEEGQERNPETNRCRNVVSAIPVADYAPEQTFEQSNNYILWWSLAGVGVVAIIYGVWEWRQEIMKLAQKIGLLVHRAK